MKTRIVRHTNEQFFNKELSSFLSEGWKVVGYSTYYHPTEGVWYTALIQINTLNCRVKRYID
jgi:hypothetical protein